jgi:hypothetical protein
MKDHVKSVKKYFSNVTKVSLRERPLSDVLRTRKRGAADRTSPASGTGAL